MQDSCSTLASREFAGATNRVDALDAALRRPGRFDRELVFPLPSLPARAAILDIHTRAWAQPPPADLLERLAQMCVGYCGADLKVCALPPCLVLSPFPCNDAFQCCASTVTILRRNPPTPPKWQSGRQLRPGSLEA